MPPFKDEHVMMIAPGSQTTLAQLGLPESFTPARTRFATRMFPAEKKGEWEPYKVREKRPAKSRPSGDIPAKGDGLAPAISSNGGGQDDLSDAEENVIYEEDTSSDEGAVYPIANGKVVDWSCFFALLTHIYNTLSPPFHTPILIITPPAWTNPDREHVTKFLFEKFQMPGLCLMDSALAVCYAYAAQTATVIDVGLNKCDVTAIRDFIVDEPGREVAVPGCGGEALTQQLLKLLEPKGFTRDMCEQLKQNPICELLPPGADLPSEDVSSESAPNPASMASTGALGPGDGQRESIAAQGGAPRGPGPNTDVGDADQDRPDADDDEGLLDVASIVASGKTSEFLAQKEREKAAKAAAKKTAAAEAVAATKLAKLPNSKRVKATFSYHERKPLDELNTNGTRATNGDGTDANSKPSNEQVALSTTGDATATARKEERREERRRHREATAYIRKEVEVGPERLQAASGGALEQIADAIHRCILSVPETSRRSELWDSLIILGNGGKIRGFKEALVATLNAKYLISPSSATIFTSELPSNFTTPAATGANTPQPQQSQHPMGHHGPGVNPLLLAATTASNANLAPPGQQQLHSQLQLQQYQQQQQMQQPHQHSHSQTPTSIRLLKAPEYFPEWKEVGMDEATFLGAQIAAKVVFVVDQGLSKGYMSRAEYNDSYKYGLRASKTGLLEPELLDLAVSGVHTPDSREHD